jgi:DNA-binding NarL/FixJ family response regulator
LARRNQTPRNDTRRILAAQANREDVAIPGARELQVLQLIADGHTNKGAAKELGLAEETVKCYVRRLLAKLQATTRAHAVAVGLRQGLIH